MNDVSAEPAAAGSSLEVLSVFLRLGLTSFGGPIAHLGYFRAEFVGRRRWLDEIAFADLVALCQFLPGPASSQVAFALGLTRAGWSGGLAAWIGFTGPSAAALVFFAFAAPHLSGTLGRDLIHGLKLVAVAVVAQAVLGMARTFCPDRTRATIAIASALVLLVTSTALSQSATIALAALAGLLFCRGAVSSGPTDLAVGISQRTGQAALAAFVILLVGLPLLTAATSDHTLAFVNAFYRSGALVFGGGHVLLPLLHDAVVTPGWVTNDAFLAGYGAAQALPGPLFTFAAYLGAVASQPPQGLAGAAAALSAIFLPGLLILIGVLPFWQELRKRLGLQAALRGVNAAVVGILAAALYDPIWVSSVHTLSDFGIALLGCVLLVAWKAPPLLVVVLGALSAVVLGSGH